MTSKVQPQVIDRRQNYTDQKVLSPPDMVIGSKKAGVQIFDFESGLLYAAGNRSPIVIQ